MTDRLFMIRVCGRRALRALERGGAPDAEHAALHAAALAAGMETPEDYMAVSLARLDCLRRQGAGSMEALRAAFQAATELMAVGPQPVCWLGCLKM